MILNLSSIIIAHYYRMEQHLKMLFQLFLIIVFIIGLYLYTTYDLKKPIMEKMNGMSSNCPNLLIQQDNTLLLYNTNAPTVPGTNPLPFYNLDEYINYLGIQRNNGQECPVLFLQSENDVQGNNVYRVRPSPFNMMGGLNGTPATSMPQPGLMTSLNNVPDIVEMNTFNRIPMSYIDSNVESSIYNQGQYAGFDPKNQFVGIYTNLDQIHDSTNVGSPFSDNPMDANWGGIQYTQAQIDSGKYEENNVSIRVA